MDRFSILWRYTCSTPSKLCHKRTIRFTLVRFTYQTFFFSFLVLLFEFSNLIKAVIYDIELSSLFYYLFQFFFFKELYTPIFVYPTFQFKCRWDTFFLVVLYFVAFHSFTGEWIGNDKLGQCWWMHLAWITQLPLPPLGKVAKEGADFPPNREHYSLHTWMEIVFDLRPRHLRLLMMRPSSNLCSTVNSPLLPRLYHF